MNCQKFKIIWCSIFTGAGGCGAFLIAQDGISLRAPGFCNANQLFDVNSEQASS